MNFNEKIMKLRKEKGWSQEEFAEKLGVSRQTISKWELGQTTPDTDNLRKMATIFGISVSELLDENQDTVKEKSKDNKNNKSTIKIIILIVILILVIMGICAILLNKAINRKADEKNNISVIEMFKQYSISEIFDEVFNQMGQMDVDGFNSKFKTLYFGDVNGSSINRFVDEVIKSNDGNSNKLITVKFNDFESSDSNEIKNLKQQFSSQKKYQVWYEYDENGYINKAIVEEGNDEFIDEMNKMQNMFLDNLSKSNIESKMNSFNSTFKTFYYGSTNAFFIKDFVDEVIKSNEENPNNLITIKYNKFESNNADEIKKLKKQFSSDSSKEYEIYYEYDENGYINKAIVED